MATYGVLCKTNPSYDPGLLQELDDLFVGGYQIIRNSKKYLLRW